MVGCPNTQKVAQLLKANLEAYASEWDLHVRPEPLLQPDLLL